MPGGRAGSRPTRSPCGQCTNCSRADPDPGAPRIGGALAASRRSPHGGAMTSTYHLGDFDVTRMGFGAMQLAGPGVFGPPKDRDAAIAVLRTAVELGVNHIDTADFYGPYVTNELIRAALAPYPQDLHIVTKVGARRDERGAWLPARTPAELRAQV